MKHFKYLKYLFRHKWHVMLACFGRGLIWRGIIHDWSKFLPSEWFPYVEYFYGEKLTEEEYCENRRREMNIFGAIISKHPDQVRDEFDLAWLLHQHRNPHHWQYHVLRNDNGSTVPMRMPSKDVLEMVSDWDGAGMAINGRNDTANWYLKNREKMILHPDTRKKVEEILNIETA